MAWAILKGLSAPALVSSAQIDSKTKRVGTERCQIQGLQVSSGSISFDRIDEALPMPIDEKALPALKLAPILDDLDRYELRITGLPAGSYELSIDSEPVTKVSAEDLDKGWNLGASAGPITKQTQSILRLVVEKNNLYYHRWRDVQLYVFPEWARSAESIQVAELKRLDAQIEEAEKDIEVARKPVSHHFELKPASP
jgi:hypothetical protein